MRRSARSASLALVHARRDSSRGGATLIVLVDRVRRGTGRSLGPGLGIARTDDLVRNLAGDPVNDFSVYRPGMPDKLAWIDNRRLGYLAPPDLTKKASSLTYVVHDADTGTG